MFKLLRKIPENHQDRRQTYDQQVKVDPKFKLKNSSTILQILQNRIVGQPNRCLAVMNVNIYGHAKTRIERGGKAGDPKWLKFQWTVLLT